MHAKLPLALGVIAPIGLGHRLLHSDTHSEVHEIDQERDTDQGHPQSIGFATQIVQRDRDLRQRADDRQRLADERGRNRQPNRAVAAVHAGWRGTVKRIVEKGVGEMVRCFGSRPRDLKAAIGPGIQGCCYEVGEEVRSQFESQFRYGASLFREVKESDPVREKYPLLFLTARAPGHSELPKKIFLDLVEANRQQLLAVGVPTKGIEASPLCTNCHPELLFSYRAEKGKTGRMMAVAGIRR